MYLKNLSINLNGAFGSLATALGGAGAIVTGEAGARILSGLSGITSGVRSEWNQALFETLTTSIIVPGIKSERNELLKEINKKRTKSIAEYSVQDAMADIVKYHSLCTMDTGIIHAEKAIQSYEDIGIKKFLEAQTSLTLAKQVRSIPDGNIISVKSELETLKNRTQIFLSSLKITNISPAEINTLDGKANKYISELSDAATIQKADAFDSKLKDILLKVTSQKDEQKTVALAELNAHIVETNQYIQNLTKEIVALEAELEAKKS